MSDDQYSESQVSEAIKWLELTAKIQSLGNRSINAKVCLSEMKRLKKLTDSLLDIVNTQKGVIDILKVGNEFCKCRHGKNLNEYCEPCGRIHGG